MPTMVTLEGDFVCLADGILGGTIAEIDRPAGHENSLKSRLLATSA